MNTGVRTTVGGTAKNVLRPYWGGRGASRAGGHLNPRLFSGECRGVGVARPRQG